MQAPAHPDLTTLQDTLQHRDPRDILAWAVDTYHPRLVMATAFGPEGCCIIAMLAQIRPAVRIINLDTGYQFPETLELRERLMDRYGVFIERVQPEESVEQMEARFGGPIHHVRPEECCRLRKVEPLRRALTGMDAWITGIRKDQTPDRARSCVVEWDAKFQIVKVNPLLHWTKADVWRFIRDHEVPYNPLHDRGYPSIGCMPCTRPVAAGQHERAGRWAGFARLECGLHTR
ncbi:MAG: phosphoadenylyl-sulfate reductase [Chthonomonadales bacterium]